MWRDVRVCFQAKWLVNAWGRRLKRLRQAHDILFMGLRVERIVSPVSDR